MDARKIMKAIITIRIFVDMDGVLAKYNFDLPSFDKLYEEFYFLNLPPQKTIVGAIRSLITKAAYFFKKLGFKIEVFVLSAVLMDSEYALFEKHDWLDREAPEIDCKHRVFTICGEDKIGGVPHFNPKTDILIDDYGPNCKVWKEAGGTYIKVSVNAEDAEKEKQRHKYVIHPEMTKQDILSVITGVAKEVAGA